MGCRFLVQTFLDNDQPAGPLLILDALSAGKPVVASDVNGTRDDVEHDVNGIVVPPHDPTALAGRRCPSYLVIPNDSVAWVMQPEEQLQRFRLNASGGTS